MATVVAFKPKPAGGVLTAAVGPLTGFLRRGRADVLEGRIRDEDFAADLSQVLKGTAPELYKNPALFFANTHPTRGLRDLFLAVVDRLTSAGSQLGSILRLDTSYGGGKTHALIGLNHILTAADQIANLAEFIDPARLPHQPVTVGRCSAASRPSR